MTANTKPGRFLALNLFDVVDEEKYAAYFSRLAAAAQPYGGSWVAFGRFRENVTGDLVPRQVLLVVEWESEESFNAFRQDPALADLHPLREDGTSAYIWQTFDGLDLFDPALSFDSIRSVLKP
ncbi:DUF1330 domain-containing protein [Mycobacterium sp. M26]|uniref:DUF1330 domain-containing protein n=1 Tax=Mycobacterium sp. M26 TaxID=1762962 RepID=UPI00073E60B0|nr:DUF1330 domain-containing protein [Mycobacterium sp. M26]